MKCEFCEHDVHTMRELEDHLRVVHCFNDKDLEEYGFDCGIYYKIQFKEEGRA